MGEFNQDFQCQVSSATCAKKTVRGQDVFPIVLPSSFQFGDNFFSQDLRLSKVFKFRERYKITILGEVFNLFNIANLSGHGGNSRPELFRDAGGQIRLLPSATFGQSNARVDQAFGSGGPRAFQLAVRFTF